MAKTGQDWKTKNSCIDMEVVPPKLTELASNPDAAVESIIKMKVSDAYDRKLLNKGEDAAKEFLDEMVESAKEAIKNQVENLINQFKELTALATAIPASIAGLAAQLTLIDPMAPIASMGVVNSAISSIKGLKGQINTFNTSMSNMVANCQKLGIVNDGGVEVMEDQGPSDEELVESCVVTIADNPFQQYISMSGEGVTPGSTQVGIKVNTEVTFTFNGEAGSLSWVINGEVISPVTSPLKYSSWAPQENIVTVQ